MGEKPHVFGNLLRFTGQRDPEILPFTKFCSISPDVQPCSLEPFAPSLSTYKRSRRGGWLVSNQLLWMMSIYGLTYNS